MPCLIELSLTAFFLLLQIEDLRQPSTSKSVGTIFSNSIFSLGDSMLHFGNSCNISNFS